MNAKLTKIHFIFKKIIKGEKLTIGYFIEIPKDADKIDEPYFVVNTEKFQLEEISSELPKTNLLYHIIYSNDVLNEIRSTINKRIIDDIMARNRAIDMSIAKISQFDNYGMFQIKQFGTIGKIKVDEENFENITDQELQTETALDEYENSLHFGIKH